MQHFHYEGAGVYQWEMMSEPYLTSTVENNVVASGARCA